MLDGVDAFHRLAEGVDVHGGYVILGRVTGMGRCFGLLHRRATDARGMLCQANTCRRRRRPPPPSDSAPREASGLVFAAGVSSFHSIAALCVTAVKEAASFPVHCGEGEEPWLLLVRKPSAMHLSEDGSSRMANVSRGSMQDEKLARARQQGWPANITVERWSEVRSAPARVGARVAAGASLWRPSDLAPPQARERVYSTRIERQYHTHPFAQRDTAQVQ